MLSGGTMGQERDQQRSRAEAEKNMAKNAKIARRNARAEEEMAQKAQRAEDSRAELDLAKLRTKLSFAAEGNTYEDVFEEEKLRRELLKKEKALEIEFALRAISEADTEERRLVKARIEEEYTLRFDELRKISQRRFEEIDAIGEREKELEDAKKKAAKERAAEELKVQTELAQAAFQMQKELADARADAEMKIAGATATFSTAGGSFTTGVNAQLNEQKLLTKISTKSQEFLKQITVNTARMGGALSLA